MQLNGLVAEAHARMHGYFFSYETSGCEDNSMINIGLVLWPETRLCIVSKGDEMYQKINTAFEQNIFNNIFEGVCITLVLPWNTRWASQTDFTHCSLCGSLLHFLENIPAFCLRFFKFFFFFFRGRSCSSSVFSGCKHWATPPTGSAYYCTESTNERVAVYCDFIN